MLYPQNGDRIVAIDSVTSLHPMYRAAWARVYVYTITRENLYETKQTAIDRESRPDRPHALDSTAVPRHAAHLAALARNSLLVHSVHLKRLLNVHRLLFIFQCFFSF